MQKTELIQVNQAKGQFEEEQILSITELDDYWLLRKLCKERRLRHIKISVMNLKYYSISKHQDEEKFNRREPDLWFFNFKVGQFGFIVS